LPHTPERFGRFSIVSRLFGDAFTEAYHANGDEGAVVLKVVNASLSGAPWYDEYFGENSELGQLVDHANVFPTLASGGTDGHLWQAFRFIDGRTVRQLLHELNQQHVMLPVEFAVLLILQACQALEHLHGLKDGGGRPSRVVHHDLAPSTLHVGFDGTVRLFDAGMARINNVGDPELTTAQLGRPAYFGPERIKGSRPTPRSDVYALGVILWELLAGRRLFAGEEREEIMAEVLIGEVVPPSEYNPDVPGELDAIVLKAIDRRVLRRYAGAAGLRVALRDFLGETPTRQLKAGLAGVMDTLFGKERAELDLPVRSEEDIEQAIATGRIAEFGDSLDSRPGPGGRDRPSEPWVKGTDGSSPMTKALVGVSVLALLGGGAWWASELSSSASDVPQVADAAELVEDLRQRNPGATDEDGLRLAKGWDELRLGTPDAVQRARTEFEVAVAADPYSADGVAGLALTYAMLGEAQFQLDAADLISRAEKLEGGQESILRAKAGVALASGNLESAESLGTSCLLALPADGLCSWYTGDALLAQGRYHESLKHLGGALDSISLSPGLHESFGHAAMLDGDFVGAEAALGKAVKLLPDEPSVHIALADLHRRTGKWDEALASIDRVLEVDPRHVRARYLKGVILLHVLDDPVGASDVLGALAEDPVLKSSSLALDAMVQASFASIAMNRDEEAQRYAELALEVDDDHAMARLAKAIALDELGQFDASEEVLRGADTGALAGREVARWHYHAALLYTRHDHQRFARLSLESALAADPLWAPPQLLLALVEMRMGEGREGLQRLEDIWVFDRAVERGRDPILLAPVGLMEPEEIWTGIDPLLPDTLANSTQRARIGGVLGILHCEGTGNCDDAVQALSRVLVEDPDDEGVRVYLAMGQMEKGDIEGAIENLRHVADEDAPSTVHALLGDCYATQGVIEEARLAFDAADQRPDRTPALNRRRAVLELQANERSQAQTYAKKARALDADDILSAGILLETGVGG